MSVYSGHEAYVYSLVVVHINVPVCEESVYRISVFLGTGGTQFLSSGEDRTVRVWRGVLCLSS